MPNFHFCHFESKSTFSRVKAWSLSFEPLTPSETTALPAVLVQRCVHLASSGPVPNLSGESHAPIFCWAPPTKRFSS